MRHHNISYIKLTRKTELHVYLMSLIVFDLHNHIFYPAELSEMFVIALFKVMAVKLQFTPNNIQCVPNLHWCMTENGASLNNAYGIPFQILTNAKPISTDLADWFNAFCNIVWFVSGRAQLVRDQAERQAMAVFWHSAVPQSPSLHVIENCPAERWWHVEWME